jgi:hypothetical protein
MSSYKVFIFNILQGYSVYFRNEGSSSSRQKYKWLSLLKLNTKSSSTIIVMHARYSPVKKCPIFKIENLGSWQPFEIIHCSRLVNWTVNLKQGEKRPLSFSREYIPMMNKRILQAKNIYLPNACQAVFYLFLSLSPSVLGHCYQTLEIYHVIRSALHWNNWQISTEKFNRNTYIHIYIYIEIFIPESKHQQYVHVSCHAMHLICFTLCLRKKKDNGH